jgi:DNA-binding FadR family transcriptional regulator
MDAVTTLTPAGGRESPSFQSIRRVPAAADEVINTIKAMILQGELVPYQRLPSEKELAEALGVSRPTVREAIRGLMALNILESRQGDGTYVTSLEPQLLAAPIDFLLRVDEQGLAALTEIRLVLESGVAEFAANKATPQHIERLRALTNEYAASIDDVDRCMELDLAFHRELADAADSAILASILSTISALVLQSRKRTAHDHKKREVAHTDHRAITDAVASHDPAGARAAMLAHVTHVQSPVTSKRRSGRAPSTA